MKWNPRFVAYAAAHEMTPQQMSETPRGTFLHFTPWLTKQWKAYAIERTKGKAVDMLSLEHIVGLSSAHKGFNDWLASRYPSQETCAS